MVVSFSERLTVCVIVCVCRIGRSSKETGRLEVMRDDGYKKQKSCLWPIVNICLPTPRQFSLANLSDTCTVKTLFDPV